jgi:hypothetical protein
MSPSMVTFTECGAIKPRVAIPIGILKKTQAASSLPERFEIEILPCSKQFYKAMDNKRLAVENRAGFIGSVANVVEDNEVEGQRLE